MELTGVSKSYAGNPALQRINMELIAGEVHALVGENGAGKSTLAKIISGGISADEGEIIFNESKYIPRSPAEGQKLGVVAVQQELSLSPYLPVYRNIWLGNQTKNKRVFINNNLLRRLTKELQDEWGTSINAEKWVSDLSLEEQQIVEILKALSLNPRIVILDEPTSALGAENTRWLLNVIARLKEQSRSILFISHRLPEIIELADSITVLKDGQKVDTIKNINVKEEDVVRMMVGRDLEDIFPKKVDLSELNTHPVLLEVENLFARGVFDVSFKLRSGEVIGLAGLEGQGQHELLLTIFGIQNYTNGSIKINGNSTRINNPSRAIDEGISLVPIDRRTEGVVLPLSVGHNLALSTLNRRQKWGWIDKMEENNIISEIIKRLAIKTQNSKTPVGYLSGGNQQKVALGKWLVANPKILILDDPTRGVDIQARKDIYYHIRDLANQGMGIIMSSTDTIELVGICDRVLVMYEGHIFSELIGNEITEERIVGAAVGVNGEKKNVI